MFGEDGEVLKDEPRGARHGGDGAAADLPPPTKLWVKDREAGRVIGRGGETIRDVMEKTGADIKVQKAEDMKAGSNEREVRLYGAQEQREQALALILNEVSWARGTDGMLKAPKEDAKAIE